MPVARSPFATNEGPVLRVRIHFSRSELYQRRKAGLSSPQPVEVLALIDTGAEATCVEPAVVAGLGLPPYSYGFSNAPALGGFKASNSFDASLAVLHPDGDSSLDLVVPEIELVALPIGALGYDAIIGRDVLAACVLIYDGTAGTFTLSY